MARQPVLTSGSFRDPSGFVFEREGQIYRQVNTSYREDYDHLMRSGLYDVLVREGLLIPHEEVETSNSFNGKPYRVIRPEAILFTSYPYEWCFSEIKDAALLTLQVLSTSLEFDMSLKDASPYNVQFRNGKPVFIDTLSFEKYAPGDPWIAYGQFCELFLAPLALIPNVDVRLRRLLRVFLEGIPLDLASKLLPIESYSNFGLLSHVHLHARARKRWASKTPTARRVAFGRPAMLGLVDSLRTTVEKLKLKKSASTWSNYYEESSYTAQALEAKQKFVSAFLERITYSSARVWDLGANTGLFSRISSGRGLHTVAFDADPVSVELNYLRVRANSETHLLPLVLDLRNPSPSLGWAHQERMSLIERGPADVVLALALIHHLAISNNLPLSMIADFMARICYWLVIEFVPKSDRNVQQLLATRRDIFTEYDETHFRNEFEKFFLIRERCKIPETERTLYLMELRDV